MIATRDILEPLGFKLKDCGDYWQTNAAFRDGDNPTAIQIYKKTGVWIDYAQGTKALPFQVLLDKMGSDAIISSKPEESEHRTKIAKLYDQSCLSRLLPHYLFYNKRGIDDKTLKLYRGGLATQGKMYQRFVFPIFEEHGKICGFSGRDMLDKEGRTKWKHLGKKQTWLYPFYMRAEDGTATMNKEYHNDIYLVESIGDSMSMTQNGLPNHFVTFGLKISSAILGKLVELNPKYIILSFNNDFSKNNAGLCAAFRSLEALSHCFEKKKLHLLLPPKKDFGEMGADDYKDFLKRRRGSKAWEDVQKAARYSLDRGFIEESCIEGIL